MSMAQCHAKKRDIEMEQFPMDPETIAKCQLTNGQIKQSSEDLKENESQGI